MMAALEAQNARASQRGGGGGGGDVEWYKTPAPQHEGMSAEYNILVLPRAYPLDGRLPMMTSSQHGTQIRGQFRSIMCVREDGKLNGGADEHTAPECAVCNEMERRYAMMRQTDRGSPESEHWKKQAGYLRPKDRIFMQVFDLDNPTRHYKQADGKPVFVPAVWGFGRGVQKKLTQLMKDVGLIWNPAGFTPLKVTVQKTGPESRDVEYSFFPDLGLINAARLPQGYEPILENLFDLDLLRKTPSPQDLAPFLPADAQPQQAVQVAVPAAYGQPPAVAQPGAVAAPAMPAVGVQPYAPQMPPAAPQAPVAAAQTYAPPSTPMPPAAPPVAPQAAPAPPAMPGPIPGPASPPSQVAPQHPPNPAAAPPGPPVGASSPPLPAAAPLPPAAPSGPPAPPMPPSVPPIPGQGGS
jgi:hypothetical protein